MFKIGERVKCINSESFSHPGTTLKSIKYHEEYTVTAVNGCEIMVDGSRSWLNCSRFEAVEDIVAVEVGQVWRWKDGGSHTEVSDFTSSTIYMLFNDGFTVPYSYEEIYGECELVTMDNVKPGEWVLCINDCRAGSRGVVCKFGKKYIMGFDSLHGESLRVENCDDGTWAYFNESDPNEHFKPCLPPTETPFGEELKEDFPEEIYELLHPATGDIYRMKQNEPFRYNGEVIGAGCYEVSGFEAAHDHTEVEYVGLKNENGPLPFNIRMDTFEQMFELVTMDNIRHGEWVRPKKDSELESKGVSFPKGFGCRMFENKCGDDMFYAIGDNYKYSTNRFFPCLPPVLDGEKGTTVETGNCIDCRKEFDLVDKNRYSGETYTCPDCGQFYHCMNGGPTEKPKEAIKPINKFDWIENRMNNLAKWIIDSAKKGRRIEGEFIIEFNDYVDHGIGGDFKQ